MKKLIATAALLGASCSSPTDDAQREYELVSQHGTVDEQCAAAREVEKAWLKTGIEDGYKKAREQREYSCMIADTQRLTRELEASIKVR